MRTECRDWLVSWANNHSLSMRYVLLSKNLRNKILQDGNVFPTQDTIPTGQVTGPLGTSGRGDIVTILTRPSSTTTPSLREGNPVQNALLDIATQLKRVEPIPVDGNDKVSTTTNKRITYNNNTTNAYHNTSPDTTNKGDFT